MAQPVAGLRAAISRHMRAPLQAPRSWRFGRRRGRARAILTVLVALSGVLNILSALIERVNAIVADWTRIIPVPILHGTRTAVVVAGFGLLLLAQGLGHGSRLAWGLTVATLIGAALLHLVTGSMCRKPPFRAVSRRCWSAIAMTFAHGPTHPRRRARYVRPCSR